MTIYEMAPEVERVVARLLESVPEHRDLQHATILCVYRDKAAVSRGKTVLGKARKLSGLAAYLARPDVVGPLFVIEIPRDLWRNMKPEQQLALVDHELCHLEVDDGADGGWVGRTRGHDVEEFLGVIDRHGLWKADVARLATAAAHQLELEIAVPEDGTAVVDRDRAPANYDEQRRLLEASLEGVPPYDDGAVEADAGGLEEVAPELLERHVPDPRRPFEVVRNV